METTEFNYSVVFLFSVKYVEITKLTTHRDCKGKLDVN